jgi:hypothetical protein
MAKSYPSSAGGLLGLFPVAFISASTTGLPRYTGDEIVPAFRQNFVKVTPDALMNGECGISATYSAVGELTGPIGPLIWEVRLRPGATRITASKKVSTESSSITFQCDSSRAGPSANTRNQPINARQKKAPAGGQHELIGGRFASERR